MDENRIKALTDILKNEEKIHNALEYIVELTIAYEKEIPQNIANTLDTSGKDWRYYNTMIFYGIRWYNLGFSPAKLKKLMNEAISEMSGPEITSGKYNAAKMFMDYLQLKKTIDSHIKIFLN